jgi:molybdate transport system substrate-binding protein
MRQLMLAVVLIATGACGGSAASRTGSDLPNGSEAELTVFAASSLTAGFTEIGARFEQANPGTTVTFNFGSSTDLAAQISSEGTADVFASASGTAMDSVADEPGVTGLVDFATNRLVVIVPPDNPAGIASLDDLTTSGVQVVMGAEGVPVGDYARQMLEHAGIEDAVMVNVVSNEPDDASIVAKVASGEADAGIVYTSDVAAAKGAVASVDVPTEVNVIASYPLGAVRGSDVPDIARAFISFVVGLLGRSVLGRYGFGPPPAG